ncbi:MAG: ABC transporter substrate-binding protein [Actinomycetota bacterium]
MACLLLAAACGDDDDGTATAASATATAPAADAEEEQVTQDQASTSEPAEEPSASEAESDEPAEQEPVESEGADGYYPVTIEHDLGAATVEAMPERIVAITDQGELAALLALGVQPVAFGQRIPGEVDYLAAAGAYDPAIQVFDSSAEVNFEELATFAPDLIVGQIGFITPDTLATFEAIAPTIPIGFDDWREGLLDVGAAIDDVAAAESKIAELEALIAGFPDRVSFAEGRSVSVALGFPGFGIYQFTNESITGVLLGDAGLVPLPEPTGEDRNGNQLSLEQISLIDGEGLIVMDFEGASMGGGSAALEFWEAQPLWPSLPAVQGDRVAVWFGGDAAASTFANALTIPVLLDAIEETLTDFFVE